MPAPTSAPFPAGRVRSFLLLKPERTPGVFKQQLGTEPAVHLSISADTTPMAELIEQYLSTADGRTALVQGLQRTTSTLGGGP